MIRNIDDIRRVRAHLDAKIRLVRPMLEAERHPAERARLKGSIDTYCEVFRDLVGRDLVEP